MDPEREIQMKSSWKIEGTDGVRRIFATGDHGLFEDFLLKKLTKYCKSIR